MDPGAVRVRALVVDEPALVCAVAGYLQHEGFIAVTAADGESALRAARADVPDVVVLDLMLPGVDGMPLDPVPAAPRPAGTGPGLV